MRLLVVEDDPALLRALEKATQEAGYNPWPVEDGIEAWNLLQRESFDLLLLDVMLPGMDGYELCRRARAMGIKSPILMLTARDTTKDKVDGLDAGADDYVVKPFQVAELLARVRALLRRSPEIVPNVLTVGPLTLDQATRHARRSGRDIRLSSTEYTLLEYLMRNAGRVLTRSTLIEHVWQYDFNGNDNVLDVYVGYLRGKIDKGEAYPLIHTVRGVGFLMLDRSAEAG